LATTLPSRFKPFSTIEEVHRELLEVFVEVLPGQEIVYIPENEEA
jgi:hypothetical protein